jgi:hypothetical protein
MRLTKDMNVAEQLWLYVAGLPLDLQGWEHPHALSASDAVAEPHQFLASTVLRAICLAAAIVAIPAAVAFGKPVLPCLALVAASFGLFYLLSRERYFG